MKLPILMFHKVAEMPAGVRYPGNYVSPALFAGVLRALRDWGYESIRVEDWLAWRDGTQALPPKPVVITFDDGYRSNRDVAWPILDEHGFRATIFLVSGCLGRTNAWDSEEVQEPLLSADDVRELRREGMSFGSHTKTHVALTALGRDAALAEMRDSRLELSEVVGAPVQVLCYPYGKQSAEVRAWAREAGYRAALRGQGRLNGPRQDPFELRRIKLDNHRSVGWLRWELLRLRWLSFG